MMPVSTLGKMETSTMTDLQFLRGKLSNTKELSDVTAVVSDQSITDAEDLTFGGYIAFDLFLKNSSNILRAFSPFCPAITPSAANSLAQDSQSHLLTRVSFITQTTFTVASRLPQRSHNIVSSLPEITCCRPKNPCSFFKKTLITSSPL